MDSSHLIKVIHCVNKDKENKIQNYLSQFDHENEVYSEVVLNFKKNLTEQLEFATKSNSAQAESPNSTLEAASPESASQESTSRESEEGERPSTVSSTETTKPTSSIRPVITPIKRLIYNTAESIKDLSANSNKCVFLDFGGKNFRVGCASFQNLGEDVGEKIGQPLLHTELQIYPVPKRLFSSSIEKIFDFIGVRF